jgi:hypothetical protein
VKNNIIIVGDYNRKDFLYVASVMHGYYNIFFLEYTHPNEVISDQYKKWGKAIFWGDYKSAFVLLDDIKPKIVLFYFIETFNHVALNATCRYKGIRTFHIEHGIRNYEMLQSNRDQIKVQKTPTIVRFFTKLKNIKSRVKGRLFFASSVKMLPNPYSSFLQEYFQVRNSKTIFETFREINNPLRIADSYISFSPRIFEFHQKSDHLPQNYPVHFIGCPSFDYLAGKIMDQNVGSNILFVDNAFEVQHLFGWSKENKVQFLQQLVNIAVTQNKRLWIKPHPYTKQEVYAAVRGKQNVFFIEKEEGFIESIKDCKIIIGFYSTLLMPLMAMGHTVCFALEMHPAKLENEPSSFLTETGAIKKIDSWAQLSDAFENLDAIFQEQKSNKGKFTEDWLYKFDGKSTERLKNILLSEAS